MAADQASAQGVKDYARMLDTDHTSDYKQLSDLAGKASLSIPRMQRMTKCWAVSCAEGYSVRSSLRSGNNNGAHEGNRGVQARRRLTGRTQI